MRQGIEWLPKAVRHEIYRSKIMIDPHPPKELRVKLAETKEELEAAFHLLHDTYVRATLMKPHPSGLRVTVYHALPSTSTIIALWNDRVVGTLSVIRSNPLGLPLERIFNTEPLKLNGSRFAEISSLAIERRFRGAKSPVLFPMLKFLYQYCIHYFGVDNKLIAVNPKHADFYEAILFFEEIEAKRVENYDFVNGHPALGRFLNLRLAYNRFAAAYSHKERAKDLFHYFCHAKFPNLEFPKREFHKVSDPFMTPELLDYFFNQRTQTFQSLSERERNYLSLQYDHSRYGEVLPKGSSYSEVQRAQRERRFDVECSGRIVLPDGNRIVKLLMKNASEHGFCATLDEPIRFGSEVAINVAVGEFSIADLEATPVWSEKRTLYGFCIKRACSEWKRFIRYLDRDQNREEAA